MAFGTLEDAVLGQAFPLDQAVGFFSLAALAAQGWDWLVALSDEVDYLWRGRLTVLKTLYFSSRYGLLALQLIDKFLYFRFQGNALHPLTCSRIFVYKTIVSQIAMTTVEMILLLRVYALYGNGFRARIFLFAIFVFSTVLECSAIKIVVDTLLESPACVAPAMGAIVERLYGLGAGSCQLVVFILTTVRLVSGRRTPLTSLMLKEGVVSFIILFVLLIVVIAYEIIRNIETTAGNDVAGTIGNAIVSWYVAILSIAGSRLVLNMRTVAVNYRLRREETDECGYASDDPEYTHLRTLTSLDE